MIDPYRVCAHGMFGGTNNECFLSNIQKSACEKSKLEDLKVLRRSPDLLNNVKIGQG